jgi:hypothetical protein
MQSRCTMVSKDLPDKPLCERKGCSAKATIIMSVCFHDGDLLVFFCCPKHGKEMEGMSKRVSAAEEKMHTAFSGGLKALNDELERLIAISKEAQKAEGTAPVKKLRGNLFPDTKHTPEDEKFGGR